MSADVLDEVLAGGLAKWFEGRKLEDLEIRELDGEALFPDTITRIDFSTRKLFDQQVFMRVPQPFELARARIEALVWMATEAKRDAKSFGWDDAERLFGKVYAEQIENICVLARALRKRSDPTMQYMTPENLQKCHPTPALWDAFNRLSMWRKQTDLRLTEEEIAKPDVFWRVIAAVAKAGHPGPLVVTDGLGVETFIVTSARQLHAYRMAQSSQPSAESSTSKG
jgi:hypothetical protein